MGYYERLKLVEANAGKQLNLLPHKKEGEETFENFFQQDHKDENVLIGNSSVDHPKKEIKKNMQENQQQQNNNQHDGKEKTNKKKGLK